MSSVFQYPFLHPPDWGDGGEIELCGKSGEIVKVDLMIDATFNGEDEIPFPVVHLKDGTHVSLYDYHGWRTVE